MRDKFGRHMSKLNTSRAAIARLNHMVREAMERLKVSK